MPDIVKAIYDTVPTAKENTSVEVKYYQGEKEVKYVYDLILKAENVHTFVNVDRIKDVFPEYIDIFSSAIKNKVELKMWEILEHHSRSSNEEDDYKNARYKYKYIPKEVTLNDTDISIFDESVALININKESPSAIVIHSKSLAFAWRNIHQMVWNLI